MTKFTMIGSTKYDGKEYSIRDNLGFVKPEAFGLVAFYGGRVKQLGKTKTPNLYLCIEKTEVINLILFNEEPVMVEVPKEPEIPEEADMVITEDDTMDDGDALPDGGTVPAKPIAIPPSKARSLPRKK